MRRDPQGVLHPVKGRERAGSEYLWAAPSIMYSIACLTYIIYLILPTALRLTL